MEKGFQQIKIEINANNLARVKDLAHKIAPPSRHLGATHLNSLLKEIEHYDEVNVNKTITDITVEAENEYLSIKTEIKELLIQLTR
ncbi:MAG: hypothetical protein HC906_10305 [Bacteroidales bacterium]|nr:hypothetical protein [Bacteroidales bacterium]